MEKNALDSRVVIIDKDGTPHYLGSVKEIEFHGEYIMDYIKENKINSKGIKRSVIL